MPFSDLSDVEDSMIFAELECDDEYSMVHDGLAGHIKEHFASVRAGIQGDSWIWILDGGEKVAIDTFTAMKHQVKSATNGAHVQKVIEVLKLKYKLKVFEVPEPEPHE